MGADDKLSNWGEKASGQAKETYGKVTDDEATEAEGRADQDRADLKQAGEKVKDIFNR